MMEYNLTGASSSHPRTRDTLLPLPDESCPSSPAPETRVFATIAITCLMKMFNHCNSWSSDFTDTLVIDSGHRNYINWTNCGESMWHSRARPVGTYWESGIALTWKLLQHNPATVEVLNDFKKLKTTKKIFFWKKTGNRLEMGEKTCCPIFFAPPGPVRPKQ